MSSSQMCEYMQWQGQQEREARQQRRTVCPCCGTGTVPEDPVCPRCMASGYGEGDGYCACQEPEDVSVYDSDDYEDNDWDGGEI